MGWCSFKLLYSLLEKNVTEMAKKCNPKSDLLSQKAKYKELFILKIKGCHKEKFLVQSFKKMNQFVFFSKLFLENYFQTSRQLRKWLFPLQLHFCEVFVSPRMEICKKTKLPKNFICIYTKCLLHPHACQSWKPTENFDSVRVRKNLRFSKLFFRKM